MILQTLFLVQIYCLREELLPTQKIINISTEEINAKNYIQLKLADFNILAIQLVVKLKKIIKRIGDDENYNYWYTNT